MSVIGEKGGEFVRHRGGEFVRLKKSFPQAYALILKEILQKNFAPKYIIKLLYIYKKQQLTIFNYISENF